MTKTIRENVCESLIHKKTYKNGKIRDEVKDKNRRNESNDAISDRRTRRAMEMRKGKR